MTTELRPKRRTKPTPEELEDQIEQAKASPEYVSPLREEHDYPGPMEEPPIPDGDPRDEDEPPEVEVDLRDEAAAIFGTLEEEPAPKHVWRPKDEHMLEMRGGAKYLPARRRVQWMRQEPDPHPEWTIKTTLVNFVMGDPKSVRKNGPMTVMDGGFAMFKAEIFDEYGRLISTGHAQEFSENFGDYTEKCETSAVARALALAGYGTESALDLDEGFIADSPFKRDGSMGGDIKIESSNIAGLVQGGRSTNATEPQIDAVRRRARELSLAPDQLAAIVSSVTGEPLDLDPVADKERPGFVLDRIRKMTFEEAATVVQMLLAADPEAKE